MMLFLNGVTNVNRYGLISIGLALSVLGGCASLTTDKMQPIKVEAFDAEGNSIKGAKCVLTNSAGTFYSETPNMAYVSKAAGVLMVKCTQLNTEAVADGVLTSRVGGAVFGNIILGGGIGAIIDTASGVAYNYPEWIQLMLNQTFYFDRKHHEDGQPTPAYTEGNQGQKIPVEPRQTVAQPLAVSVTEVPEAVAALPK